MIRQLSSVRRFQVISALGSFYFGGSCHLGSSEPRSALRGQLAFRMPGPPPMELGKIRTGPLSGADPASSETINTLGHHLDRAFWLLKLLGSNPAVLRGSFSGVGSCRMRICFAELTSKHCPGCRAAAIICLQAARQRHVTMH